MRVGLLAILLAVASGPLRADQTPPAVSEYARAHAAVSTAPAPRSLEPLLTAAEAVQDALMTLGEDDLALIERLDDAQFEALQGHLPGLRLHRGLDVHVEIEASAFRALAERHGRPEDQAFWRLYERSHNEQRLPVYLRFGARVTPCIRFGEPVLFEQFEAWRGFAAEHPNAYRAFVARWIGDLEDVFAQGTCTCTEEQAPVEASLEAFIARYPEHAVTPAVRTRLSQLRNDPYARPVWCR